VKKISLLIGTLILSVALTGCGAEITEKPVKFKIIDVSADEYGSCLILIDETNNRVTRHTIYDNYKFNADFKIKSKEDLIGKYLYSDVYSSFKQDTVIRSE